MFENTRPERKPPGFGAALFPKIASEGGARDAASMGWLVAAWIAVTYAFTVFVSVAAGSLVVAVVGLVVAALAAGLAWTIRSRQPRWASIVLLLWVILETIARLVMSPSPTAIIGVILTVVAVSSVRGAFKLAEHRSGGFSAKDAPDVFS